MLTNIQRINNLLLKMLLDDALSSGPFWIEYTQTMYTSQHFRVYHCGRYLGAVTISPMVTGRIIADEISRFKLAAWLHSNGFQTNEARIIPYGAKTVFETQGHVKFKFEAVII